jgi:hypothetical protein
MWKLSGIDQRHSLAQRPSVPEFLCGVFHKNKIDYHLNGKLVKELSQSAPVSRV